MFQEHKQAVNRPEVTRGVLKCLKMGLVFACLFFAQL